LGLKDDAVIDYFELVQEGLNRNPEEFGAKLLEAYRDFVENYGRDKYDS